MPRRIRAYSLSMNVTNRTTVLLLGVIAAVLVGWVLHVGAAILQPIVIATLLASMLQPLVRALAKLRIPPAFTVMAITGLLFFGLIQMGLLFEANARAFLGLDEEVAPTHIQQEAEPRAEQEVAIQKQTDQDEGVAGALEDGPEGGAQGAPETGEDGDETPKEAPDRRTDLEKSRDAAGDWSNITKKISIRLLASDLPGPISTYLSQAIQDLELTPLAEGLAASGYGFIKGLVLVLIFMVFIFSEQAVFRRKILAIADERSEEAAEILDTIGRGIQRYLGVKTVVSFLTGSLCYVVLQALDIPYALLFGFITFLLNYIPTFGSIIAGIFPTITALALEPGLAKPFAVIITYVSVNLTLGSFIEPRILGRELNLSPLVVVFSVVIWAGLWGIVGGFLAVPLTAVLQITLASSETTLPIAIMMGSGPQKTSRKERKQQRKDAEAAA